MGTSPPRLRAFVLAGILAAFPSTTAVAAQAPEVQARNSAGKPPVDAPEIDPSLSAGILVLLVGGVLVLTSRGRRRDRAS